jgi:hypothetical protein
MKDTDYEKLHATVTLCITANSNTLPPHILLNRKTVPKENFYEDITVWAPPPQSMDGIRVKRRLAWMRKGMWPGALRSSRGMLAMEVCCGHLPNRI